jgi:pimeloyl-[acyl-carrier protein] methyl ester esterase
VTDRTPDLVLIHGWGLGSAIWAPAVEKIETETPHCRVHLIDLPGYSTTRSHLHKHAALEHAPPAHALGETPPEAPPPPTFTETAARLTEMLRDNLPAGCILCGWSLGSLLALEIARYAPQQIKGLILVGSTPSFTQRTGWRHAQPPALLDTFTDALRQNAEATLQRFIAVLNQGDAQARTLSRQMTRLLMTSALPDPASLFAGLDWLREFDLRASIPSIATPALLIHGEHDPLMPLAAAQWLESQLPEARLELFAGSAHAPFLADPERFARLAAMFCHDLAAR